MNVEEFKTDILKHTIKPGAFVLVEENCHFVASQYVKEISEQRKKTIEVVDDLSELSQPSNDIFGASLLIQDVLYVCFMKEFDGEAVDKALTIRDDLVIIADKVKLKGAWESRIVEIPRLEDWQIKDYLYSRAEGVDSEKLDWLLALCQNDIYRIAQEADKLALFEKSEQNKVFQEFIDDDVFGDMSTYSIFNMSNAILDKNLPELKRIWEEIDRIDVEPLGMVTILRNNIRNIMKIQLGTTPTPESCGMKPAQFYAVSKSCGKFSKERLLEIFSMLTDIDIKLKTGEMPAEMILDYVILNVLK